MKVPRFLSHADAAWLHMDEPENLMVITGVLRLRDRLSAPDLRQRLADGFLCHDRFHWKAYDPSWAPPSWSDSPVNLDYHVVVAQAAGEASLMELVGQLMATPLDHARPLWQVHMVDMPASSALVIRIHHALGDGVAMMHVLNSLTDVPSPTYNAPHQSPPSLLSQIRSALRATADLVFQVLLKAEPSTSFKGPLGVAQGAAVSKPLPLEAVKAIGKAAGATVNDVLLACLTGALRRTLLEQGQILPPDLQIRVVMPVDLRSSGDERLGNRFGLAFVSLPVGIADARQRLAAIHHRVEHLRRTPHAQIIYAILKLAGMLPRPLERQLVRIFGSRATGVATNVPGPRHKMTIAGNTVQDLMFWVPRSGRLALGISIISYAGEVRVGIAGDRGLIPHPGQIVDFFHQEFAEFRP